MSRRSRRFLALVLVAGLFLVWYQNAGPVGEPAVSRLYHKKKTRYDAEGVSAYGGVTEDDKVEAVLAAQVKARAEQPRTETWLETHARSKSRLEARKKANEQKAKKLTSTGDVTALSAPLEGGLGTHPWLLAQNAVEPSLRKALTYDATRMREQMLPRAHDPACRAKIERTADYIEHSFQRYFPRHEFAELNCPVDTMQGNPPSKDESNEGYIPVPSDVMRTKQGKPRCNAVLVFAMLVTANVNVAQLDRVLSRLVRQDHFYHFSVDVSASVESRNTLVQTIARLMKKYGPAKGYKIGQDVDVIYTGSSLVKAYVLAWRDSLAEWPGQWDHILNLSPADYPLRSVEFMSRWLARQGSYNYASSWFQNADASWNRASNDWLVECPTEGKTGYVYRLYSELKPKVTGMYLYGGTAFTTLHYSFVNYTWSCLVDKTSADPHCAAIKGLWKYTRTNFCPEELFVQTALENGPFCQFKGGPGLGNLRWESWDQKNVTMFGEQHGSDKHTVRPGAITLPYAKSMRGGLSPPHVCLDESEKFNVEKCREYAQKFLGRKFSITIGGNPVYDMIDEFAKLWDGKVMDTVWPCEGEAMILETPGKVLPGYKGCYKDIENPRALTGDKIDLDKNTPDQCMQHCKSRGFGIAAMQYGIECYCGDGDEYTKYAKLDDKLCGYRCPGDHAVKCGGYFIMSVYSVADADAARAASKKGRAKAKVAQKAKKLGEKSKKSRKPKKPTSVLKKLRAMAKAGAVGNDGGFDPGANKPHATDVKRM